MVRTAVILAAGMGSRLKERTKEQPKGFLTLDTKPIVEQSICKLLNVGIERIVIGTGYLSEAYDHLALKYPQIQCVQNPNYMNTGSMYTLYNLRSQLTEDILLLESDLLYEKNGLEQLLQQKESNVILGGKLSNSNDEVFIEANEHQHLMNMSKNRNELGDVFAELTGLAKISYQALLLMYDFAEVTFGEQPKLDYETVLVGISSKVPFFVHKLNDFVWCEIDNEDHLYRAKYYINPLITLKEKNFPKVKRNKLLNPGPATTTDTVKYAQIVPDICPREGEFGGVMEMISTELTQLVANSKEYCTILFGGSGTAAVESILSSVIGDKAVLIINNGAYGKRMCQIADVYRLNYFVFDSSTTEPLNIKALEAMIQPLSGKISHLAVVHNETTTGLLNDLFSIGQICKKYQIQLIVDAMSSFAAIPIKMESMNISYLAASSNKNLQGMAGVSFVIARKEDLEATKQLSPRNLYLHLYSQYQNFLTTKQMRFTPPVQTLYALKQAIIETKIEGVENRYLRYSEAWETLIKGITRLGLTHLVKQEHHSRIITAINEPSSPQYDFEEMHDYFYKNGFTIYPGKLDRNNTFRIANIGDVTYLDMELFIQLLERYLIKIGHCHERKE